MSTDNPTNTLQLLPKQCRPYLDLLAQSLTNYLYLGGKNTVLDYATISRKTYDDFKWKICEEAIPHTLLHQSQLCNIESCIVSVVRDGVAGDIIEAGVWRGGAAIYMRAVLSVLGVTDRNVWLADTFEGIPKSTRYTDTEDPVDAWEDRWSASVDQVRTTFARYGMLDKQVMFLKGPFSETLNPCPTGALSVVRLDGDAYESTRDAIEALYPCIQPGGYIIVDDWHLDSCRRAILEYREKHGIEEKIVGLVAGNKNVPREAFWRIKR